MKNTDDTTDTPGTVLHDLEGRPDGVRGGVHRAGHHAVGEPELDHHRAEVGHVLHHASRAVVEVDALVPAALVVLLREPLAQLLVVRARAAARPTTSTPRRGGLPR